MIKKWYGKTNATQTTSDRPGVYDYTVTITGGTVITAVLRRSGSVVTLNLTLTGVSYTNAFIKIGEIPTSVAPDHNVACVPNGVNTSWLVVNSDGEIQVYGNPSHTGVVRCSLAWVLPR